jgi:hypothetical protein
MQIIQIMQIMQMMRVDVGDAGMPDSIGNGWQISRR